MRPDSDPLYLIFERHLMSTLVEDESTEQFLDRVVQDYLQALGEKAVIPHEIRSTVENDLRDEVLQMLRKKTYGHYSLADYRKSQTTKTVSGPALMTSAPAPVAQPPAKSRRRFRRAN